MKKLIIFVAAFCVMLTGCSTAIFEEGEEATSDTHYLKVKTASSTDDVIYPLQVYAYDANGKEVKNQEITSESDELSMELTTGTYTIAAVSGSTDFSQGYQLQPLMLAKGDVTITTKDVNINLAMKYAVAQLSIEIDKVPEEVKSVEVSLNSICTKVSSLGEPSNDKEVKLSCEVDEQDGLWKTGTVYVLPSVGEALNITISFVYSDGTYKPHTYTYNGSLAAGTPYHFKGSYDSGIVNAKVTFTLEGAQWADAVNNEFAFGEGVNENGNIPASSDASVFYVDEMPTACSVWTDKEGEKHVVATIDEDGNALLLSKEEWENVSSADEGAASPNQAFTLASDYSEGTIVGWNMPTEEQAEIFIDIRFQLIEALGLKNLESKQHLCSDALKCYNLSSRRILETTINNKYYLRLVKPVQFILKQQ